MITTRIKDAPLVWNHLNGIINAFKPAGMKSKHVKYAIIGNITKGKLYLIGLIKLKSDFLQLI